MMSLKTVLSVACTATVAGIVTLAQTMETGPRDDLNVYLNGETTPEATDDPAAVTVTPGLHEQVRHRLANVFNPAVAATTPALARGVDGWRRIRDEAASRPARKRVDASSRRPARRAASGGGSQHGRLRYNNASNGEFSMVRRTRAYQRRLESERRRTRDSHNRINNSRIQFNTAADRIFSGNQRRSVFQRSRFYQKYGSFYSQSAADRKRRSRTSGRFRGR